MKSELTVTREIDHHTKQPIIKIPIKSRKNLYVTMDEADYGQLQKQGVSLSPFIINNGYGNHYVRVHKRDASGSQLTLSRLIMGAGSREAVYSQNGDYLDLRRINLRVGTGKAKRDDADIAFLSTMVSPV